MASACVAALTPSSAFGVSLATNNVLFLEENVIVYPCGHSVVVYNAENNVQLHLLPC